jgi:serine O-acetyltransferase
LGVVIGRGVKLGDNIKIYQNVTIGTVDGKTYPTIGNNVTI